MPGKKVRREPAIQSDNRYLDRQEHVMCHGENCRNVVAVSKSKQLRGTGRILCTPCRKKG